MRKVLIDAVPVESDYDFLADHHGRGGAALVFINQFLQGALVGTDISIFELDTSTREVGLHGSARRSTRLGENDNFQVHAPSDSRSRPNGAENLPYTYWISYVIFAVLLTMPATEQYFVSDKCTASSIALCETLPPTRYTSFTLV